MGDINHAPYTPHWKRLYEAAILESDPAKLLERIALAQSAVLNQLEDGVSKPSDSQQLVLHDALHMLSTLRTIAERDIRVRRRIQRRTVKDWLMQVRSKMTKNGWHQSYQAALFETDWTKMEERIQTAESDIHQRELMLSQDHGGTGEERTALVNAMSGLRVLRVNVASWLERQNLGGTLPTKLRSQISDDR